MREELALLRIPDSEAVEKLEANLLERYSARKVDRVRARIMATELLRLLKPRISYRELSAVTGLPESVLCRYTKGEVVPNFEQAIKILARLVQAIDIHTLLRGFVERDRSVTLDLSRVLTPYAMRLLSIIVALELADTRPSKLIATSDTILPVATLVALELNAPVIFIKRRMYPTVHYHVIHVVRSPREIESLYLDRDLLGRGENVVVLADVVYTGRTLRAVLETLNRLKVNVERVVVILGLGEGWKARLSGHSVKVLTTVPPPSIG
ncbi:MAG: phosphoribosyltransferase family protein [Desulfurococcaceae archaeon]